MDDALYNVLEIHDEQRRKNRGNLRIQRRRLRDTSDPFSLNENQFRELYR